MRLLVDAQAISSTSSLRGIGRYALSLTRALVAEAGSHQVELLLGGGARSDRLLRARLALEGLVESRAIHVFESPWPGHGVKHPWTRPAAEAAYAAAVASIGADALLVLSAFERDDETVLAVEASRSAPPTAAVLYDLMPAIDPGTYLMGPEAAAYWQRYRQLASCDALLAISEHSAAQARTLLGEQCPALTTVWGGPYASGDFPDFEMCTDEPPGWTAPERFVLSVGGDHPRKNLDRLVEGWGRVPPQVRGGRSLVLACRLNPGTVRRLQLLARRAGLREGELVLTGRVSEAELTRLYEQAELFVFPSVEEGLGMPALEAMAAGCPTLLARGSSLSELSDDDAVFFDPLSAEDLGSAVTRVLDDANAMAHLGGSAARSAERFTWKATATRAWSALEALPAPEPPVRDVTSRIVRSSDPAALQGLAAAPAVVLLDRRLPEGPRGTLGLPVTARAALAPATALLVSNREDAGWAVRAGLLDQPVLQDPEQLRHVSRHDFLAELGPRLAHLELRGEAASAVVAAARRGPRWALERLRPAWLLISATPVEGVLADRAATHGVDLVVGTPAAAGLAGQVDVVLLPADGVAQIQAALVAARCRGTRVVALHADHHEVDTPPWCVDAVLHGPVADPASWFAYLEEAAPGPRTTGWPWRSGG